MGYQRAADGYQGAADGYQGALDAQTLAPVHQKNINARLMGYQRTLDGVSTHA
jgi:hypothetical protein